jgi:hypothetical protein
LPARRHVSARAHDGGRRHVRFSCLGCVAAPANVARERATTARPATAGKRRSCRRAWPPCPGCLGVGGSRPASRTSGVARSSGLHSATAGSLLSPPRATAQDHHGLVKVRPEHADRCPVKSRSALMVAKNDSARALSQHCPVRPTESRTPNLAAVAVYWAGGSRGRSGRSPRRRDGGC